MNDMTITDANKSENSPLETQPESNAEQTDANNQNENANPNDLLDTAMTDNTEKSPNDCASIPTIDITTASLVVTPNLSVSDPSSVPPQAPKEDIASKSVSDLPDVPPTAPKADASSDPVPPPPKESDVPPSLKEPVSDRPEVPPTVPKIDASIKPVSPSHKESDFKECFVSLLQAPKARNSLNSSRSKSPTTPKTPDQMVFPSPSVTPSSSLSIKTLVPGQGLSHLELPLMRFVTQSTPYKDEQCGSMLFRQSG